MRLPKRHKLAALGPAAIERALADHGGNVAATARALEVSRDSLHTWLRAGKVRRPGGPRLRVVEAPTAPATAPSTTAEPPALPESAEAFVTAVRRRYELTIIEDNLLELAADALRLARDPEVTPAVRLAAAGRFQSLVKDLKLPTEEPAHGSHPKFGARGAIA